MTSSKLSFVHVGDIHAPDEPEGLFKSISKPGADFIVTGGDNVQRGLDSEYENFTGKISRVKSPVYIVRGNHDRGRFGDYMESFLPVIRGAAADRKAKHPSIHLWNGAYWDKLPCTSAQLAKPEPEHYPFYENVQGHVIQIRDSYECVYTFRKGGWRFVVLDSSLWVMSEHRLGQVKAELKKSGRLPTVVFIHHSLLPCGIVYDSAPLWNRWELLDILASAPCVKAVFHGHLHMNRIWNYRGMKIVCTGLHGLRRVSLGQNEIEGITPLEKYENGGRGQDFENRYFFISSRSGDMFLLRDSRLWCIRGKRRNVPYNGYAWAAKKSRGDVGIEWKFYIDKEDINRDYRLAVNFAVKGGWAAQVRQGVRGAVLEERRGRGSGDYREEEIFTSFCRAGEYRLRFFQPGDQRGIYGRAAYFAFVSPVSRERTDLNQREPR